MIWEERVNQTKVRLLHKVNVIVKIILNKNWETIEFGHC